MNYAEPTPLVTLSRADLDRYSIARALDSILNRKARGIEYEISEHLRSRAYGASANSTLVPMATFAVRANTPIAATVGTSGGSALVGTDLETAGFINALRPVSRVLQLGATTISDLKRNLDIPRAVTGASAEWVIEGQTMPENEGSFDKVTLKPHLASGYIQLTRDMLALLTPEAEMMIRRDVAKGIGAAIDAAAIAGTGVAPQPTGILNQAGIGSVALGANGGPITVAAMDDLEAAVTEANVDGSTFGYLTTPAQVRKLRGLVDTAGRPIWQTYPDPDAKPAPGHWNGRIVAGSNNVPSNLTKGTGTNLSAIIFGLWSDLIIADWGYLELIPNPYGAGYSSGTLEVVALLYADIGVRHPESFAAIVDAT